MRKMAIMMAAVVALVVPTLAVANGLNENGSFQFQDSGQRAVNSANLDLMERYRNGYYDSGIGSGYAGTTNYSQTVNCNAGSTGCVPTGTGATGLLQTNIGSMSTVTNSGSGSATLSATQTNSGTQGTPVGTPLGN